MNELVPDPNDSEFAQRAPSGNREFIEVSMGLVDREKLIAWRDEYAADVLQTVPPEFHGEINQIIDGNNGEHVFSQMDGFVYGTAKFKFGVIPDDDCPVWIKLTQARRINRIQAFLPLLDSSMTPTLSKRIEIPKQITGDGLLQFEFGHSGWRVFTELPPRLMDDLQEQPSVPAIWQGPLPAHWGGPEVRIWSREFSDYHSVITLMRNDFVQKRVDVYRLQKVERGRLESFPVLEAD